LLLLFLIFTNLIVHCSHLLIVYYWLRLAILIRWLWRWSHWHLILIKLLRLLMHWRIIIHHRRWPKLLLLLKSLIILRLHLLRLSWLLSLELWRWYGFKILLLLHLIPKTSSAIRWPHIISIRRGLNHSRPRSSIHIKIHLWRWHIHHHWISHHL
jgi:hypothetical protein